MARCVRAGQNSANHRRASQRRDREDPCRSGGAQEFPGLGTGACRRNGRTVRRARSRGLRQVWTAGEGLEHKGRVAGKIMPFSTYLPDQMGSAKLTPAGPFVAGSYADLTLTYTAGTFGIDDTGRVKIWWRPPPDMSKPQFDKPQAANFTTVEASNGARLEVWFDRLNVRPYANTLLIRVGRGYLRSHDTLTIRLGDRRQGSPGYRLQTNVEANVELKTSVDAFATYEFCELPLQPAFDDRKS